jgi:hypothetical protein
MGRAQRVHELIRAPRPLSGLLFNPLHSVMTHLNPSVTGEPEPIRSRIRVVILMNMGPLFLRCVPDRESRTLWFADLSLRSIPAAVPSQD